MALSSDGKVYGWGYNTYNEIEQNLKPGIIVNEKGEIEIVDATILDPKELIKLNETIKSIHCTTNKSFALTFNGKIFCYPNEKYMEWGIPGEVIIELFTDGNQVYCQTNVSLYERRDEKWIEIDYNNLFEYYVIRNQKTYKTIHIKNGETFLFDFILNEKSNEVNKSLKSIDFNESKLTISSSVFRDIPKTLKSDVKCFYKLEEFEFLVMNNNKVYVIGNCSLKFGKLGLGDLFACHVLT